MEEIASNRLVKMLIETGNEESKDKFIGPEVVDDFSNSSKKYIWRIGLDWGDSALVQVIVYRNIFLSGISNYLFPRINMDQKWNYINMGKIGSIHDVFENNQTNTIDSTLKTSNLILPDSIKFIISTDKIVYLLNEGYFELIKKLDNRSVLKFYESIAILTPAQALGEDSLETSIVELYLEDSLRIRLNPVSINKKEVADYF